MRLNGRTVRWSGGYMAEYHFTVKTFLRVSSILQIEPYVLNWCISTLYRNFHLCMRVYGWWRQEFLVETQGFASLLKGVVKLPGKTQPPESSFIKGDFVGLI